MLHRQAEQAVIRVGNVVRCTYSIHTSIYLDRTLLSRTHLSIVIVSLLSVCWSVNTARQMKVPTKECVVRYELNTNHVQHDMVGSFIGREPACHAHAHSVPMRCRAPLHTTREQTRLTRVASAWRRRVVADGDGAVAEVRSAAPDRRPVGSAPCSTARRQADMLPPSTRRTTDRSAAGRRVTAAARALARNGMSTVGGVAVGHTASVLPVGTSAHSERVSAGSIAMAVAAHAYHGSGRRWFIRRSRNPLRSCHAAGTEEQARLRVSECGK